VIILNTLMYTAVFSRMIPSQALISGIPELTDRGAFMSINSSVQQLGGGVASAVGGMIIAQNSTGQLLHYDILGYVTNVAIILCVIMMYFVNRYIKRQANIARGRDAQPAAKDNLAIAAE
jgi:predicted MFS family arabinose efflux permease